MSTPDEFEIDAHGFPRINVLRDSLCVCYSHDNNPFVIWQMKEFGVQKSWTLLVSVRLEHLSLIPMIIRSAWLQTVMLSCSRQIMMVHQRLFSITGEITKWTILKLLTKLFNGFPMITLKAWFCHIVFEPLCNNGWLIRSIKGNSFEIET